MSSSKSKKNIVKLMRKVREKLSSELIEMSLEEEKLFLRKQIEKLKSKRIQEQPSS